MPKSSQIHADHPAPDLADWERDRFRPDDADHLGRSPFWRDERPFRQGSAGDVTWIYTTDGLAYLLQIMEVAREKGEGWFWEVGCVLDGDGRRLCEASSFRMNGGQQPVSFLLHEDFVGFCVRETEAGGALRGGALQIKGREDPIVLGDGVSEDHRRYRNCSMVDGATLDAVLAADKGLACVNLAGGGTEDLPFDMLGLADALLLADFLLRTVYWAGSESSLGNLDAFSIEPILTR